MLRLNIPNIDLKAWSGKCSSWYSSLRSKTPKITYTPARNRKMSDEDEGTLSGIKAAIRSQAREDERPNAATLSLKKILAGDFFTAEGVRKQMWLILLIVGFIIVYISMRYNVQQDLIRIATLEENLKDARYRAMAASSMLTEKCRESNVLRLLKQGPDSTVHLANQPPFIIEIPEE